MSYRIIQNGERRGNGWSRINAQQVKNSLSLSEGLNKIMQSLSKVSSGSGSQYFAISASGQMNESITYIP
jgi:hypothetical protein